MPTEVVAAEETGKSLRALDPEATRVQHTSVPTRPATAARGKRQHFTDVGTEIGDHTDVVEIGQPATLPEFDASAPEVAAVGSGDLVAYDHENNAPFEGMLISNRYRLESRIGTGGFGVVFDAVDKQENQRVAIKILSPALSQDRRALARFRREAISASRIQHPGIIKISDFGIEDEGISYIVMEFLPGRDLAALLESEGKLEPRRAASLVMQCAEALSAAHRAGVLHRDLKPANIFVIEENGHERVKIIDFGIAKDRGSNPRTADLTSASKVVGTPYYMSPEQARGLELDGRADVYSLGVILFELLTGTRPFEGPSVLEILMAHSKAPRLRPSVLRPELASEVALEDAVIKSIQARTKSRFGDMSIFATALGAYLNPTSVPAYASLNEELVMAHASRTDRVQQVGSAEVTRKRGLFSSRFPLPLWTAVVPALALVLLFSLLRPDDEKTAAREAPAASESEDSESEAEELEKTPEGEAAAEDEVAREDETETMEFDVAEVEANETSKKPREPERSSKPTQPPSRKQAAVETRSKGKSDSNQASARKTPPRTQAISEW